MPDHSISPREDGMMKLQARHCFVILAKNQGGSCDLGGERKTSRVTMATMVPMNGVPQSCPIRRFLACSEKSLELNELFLC